MEIGLCRKFFAGVLGIALAVSASVAGADDAQTVTYARDIAPILNKNCAECHRPGQIGPMSLLSYKDVRPWAKSIKKTVVERSMPPWDADPAYGKFDNDCSLSEDQIQKISAWVDQGAPVGDPNELPPVPQFDETGWRFGKPEQVFSMKPYDVPDDIEDEYKHFVVETGLEKDMSIKAMEVRAGLPKLVHHVLVFILPEGEEFTHLMSPRAMMKSTFLTGWAPGTNPLIYDDNYGKILPAHSKLLLQVHYHKTPGPGTGGIDQSELGVKYSETPIANPTTTAWVMDPTIQIPAGAENYESISKFKFVDDGEILGLVPHMHLRGKDFTFVAEYPDGTKETLLSVPHYDFNWQIAYTYAEPKQIPKGTVVHAIAHWDNSAKNPTNPDPTADVYFGEATTDEMMIGFMEYSYKTKKHMQGKFGMPESMKGSGPGFGAFGAAAQRSQDEDPKAMLRKFREQRKRG